MFNLYNAFRVFADTRLKALAKREQGVTIVEYAIMLALIAIAVRHYVGPDRHCGGPGCS
jgi:hypothetical protein